MSRSALLVVCTWIGERRWRAAGLDLDGRRYQIHRLTKLNQSAALPFALKILLENLLRHEDGESVSKTLEYAYDDWCIAQMAHLLGDRNAYRTYLERVLGELAGLPDAEQRADERVPARLLEHAPPHILRPLAREPVRAPDRDR